MLTPKTEITFTQQPNTGNPGRNASTVTVLNFIGEGEIISTWQKLTDTATLKFPRNVYVIDANGNTVQWTNKNISSGVVPTSGPLFVRGDKVSIRLGYTYDDGHTEMNTCFEGYISKIKNKQPIEIECEDNMWKLKQLMCPNKFWPKGTYNVSKIIKELVQGTGFNVVDDGVDLNVGDVRTLNETVAGFLERLRKEANIYCYFRGSDLRCSGIVYYPIDRRKHVFAFQQNIIDGGDGLDYLRKEDLTIAIKARAIIDETSGVNQDGSDKKKQSRLEVLVGIISQAGKSTRFGEIDPYSFLGETRDQIYLGATTKEELIRRASIDLPKFYYSGFRGSFSTFGQPFARHGDIAILQDDILPERSGEYFIKQVTIPFGTGGLFQKIMLHLRVDEYSTNDQINTGF